MTEKAWVVDDDLNQRFPLWTRGNVGEVFPAVVSPTTWSLFEREVESGWRDALGRIGAFRGPGAFGDEWPACIGVYGGYAYLNVSVHRIMAVRTPGLTPADMDRSLFGESEAPAYVEAPGDRDLRATLRVAGTVMRALGAKRLPELDADKEEVARWLTGLPDPVSADDARLLRTVDEMRSMFRRLFGHHIHTTFVASIPTGLLNKLCADNLGDPGLALRLLAGIGDVESAEPAAAFWELGRSVATDPHLSEQFAAGVDGLDAHLRADPAAAAFVRRFDDVCARFGARGPNEWETSSPTYGTDPRLGLAAVECLRQADAAHDPARLRAALAADREAATADAQRRLRRRDRPLFARALRSAAVWSQGRERSKTTIIRAMHGMRLAQRELARRGRERGGPERLEDFWLLTAGETRPYLADPGSFTSVLAERRARSEELGAAKPPFVFVGEQPDPATWPRRAAGDVELVRPGDQLRGIGGCPGVAKGRARVVLDPADPRGLAPGDVLIAPITDPSWTPLFLGAEAVVVDVGAQMSHAVIVSRELGIPCVVSVTGGTRRIPDGALVEVDGSTGTVRVLEG